MAAVAGGLAAPVAGRAQAPTRITISGYVRDAASGEALIGAVLYFPALRVGATANTYGFYSISLPPTDSIGLVVTYLGYAPQASVVQLRRDRRLDVGLRSTANTLEEATVEGSRAQARDNVVRPQMGVVDVPMALINRLPVLFGERDPLKVIQLLPGVQSGNEGTTGYHVRGGASDQNLVILDEATVYNPNHLFGLFSTFNTSAISKVTLVKGGFPAYYGGRLSSILDIAMREGNRQQTHVDGSVGLITSGLTVDGPLGRGGKGSYIVSGRHSYVDLVLKAFNPGTNYSFYDTNLKLNYDLGPRDRVFLSGFRGRDNAQYTGSSSLNYTIGFGNSTGTMRWNHLLGQRAFVNTSVIFNDYLLNVRTNQGGYLDQIYSGIRDWGGKVDVDFYPSPSHQLRFGAAYTYHTYRPGATANKVPKPTAPQLAPLTPEVIKPLYAHEAAAYANDEISLSPRLGLNLGLRAPFFQRRRATYIRLEPRATVRWSVTEDLSVKAAYTRMNQFFNELPSATASFPTDIYLPSSAIIKPQVSDQTALGAFRNFHNNAYEVSVEGYYKTMRNQVNFREGTLLQADTDLDRQLAFGRGWSYGAEVLVKRNAGRLTGWVGYTLAWTWQQFPDLNYGRRFPFRYDRRHSFTTVAAYDLTPRWTFSAAFVFNTGHPITLPNGRVSISGGGSLYDTFYGDYSGRNSYRLGAYHRLDLSATYRKERHFFKHAYQSEWVFGVYNAYSRRNPYFIFLETDATTHKVRARQAALLPIVPSVAYHFTF